MKYLSIISLVLCLLLSCPLLPGSDPPSGYKLDEADQGLLALFLRIAAAVDADEASTQAVVPLLHQAAESAALESQKKYLSALAEDIAKGDLANSHSLWLQMTGQRVDMVLTGAKETQTEKEKQGWQALVYVIDPAETKKVEAYVAEADRMMEKSEIKKYLAVDISAMIAPILVADLVSASQLDRLVWLAPEEPLKGVYPGFRLIVFKNALAAYFNHIMKPTADRLLSREWLPSFDFDAYFLHVILHRLCHYIGPVVSDKRTPDKKSGTVTTVQEALEEQFTVIEEVKARTMAVHHTKLLVEDQLISKEQESRAPVAYFVTLLERLRCQPEAEHNLPYLLQFNYLLQKGAVRFDISRRKFSLHPANMKKATAELLSSVLEIQKSGSTSKAEKLIQENGSLQAELKEAVKQLAGLPLKIELSQLQPDK
jgi:hypothetical protein